jgi:hypothetical protein
MKATKIMVKGTDILILDKNGISYISLTDIIRPFGNEAILYNWLRNKNTIEFLGLWEKLNNPYFKPIEFDRFKNLAGLNRFILSPKQWITNTDAIGFIVKSGRFGGGTYAHQDITFEFCSWLSPEFKLYLIKEFQRLKEVEARQNSLDWNLQRTISKINYRIHTDAIKDNLIPPMVNKEQIAIIYATEADLLNVALFGMTAKEWREQNPDKQGNVRDHAPIEHLVVLSNLESLNALLISKGITQGERLQLLNETARGQLISLYKGKQVGVMKNRNAGHGTRNDDIYIQR